MTSDEWNRKPVVTLTRRTFATTALAVTALAFAGFKALAAARGVTVTTRNKTGELIRKQTVPGKDGSSYIEEEGPSFFAITRNQGRIR